MNDDLLEQLIEQPLPEKMIDRAHVFARDLVYGADNGLWGAKFNTLKTGDDTRWVSDFMDTGKSLFKYIQGKWNYSTPPESLMLSLGYFSSLRKDHYILTPKARQLPHTQTQKFNTFISYQHGQSSALSLLIEAQFQKANLPAPFIDKNIPVGDDWHGKLEGTVRDCKHFICLIGPTTLESEFVQKEIAWAEQYGCKIYSIWHGCKMGDGKVKGTVPDILRRKQGIVVEGTGAKHYETAISELLNSMGYSTY